jgi:hypothetical protein
MPEIYKPLFFTEKQYKVFVKVVDAMIDTPEEPVIPPEQVAQRVDKLINQIDSPALDQLGTIMWLVNWLLPTMILKPGLFVNHDRETRRKAIRKVIQKRGMFRDVARGLKVLSCVAYYSSAEGKKQVGYVDFEDRESTKGKNQKPIDHLDIPKA